MDQEDLRTFMHLRTKDSSMVRMIFFATSDGSILKLSHPASLPTPACLVESLSPFAASRLGVDLARQCFHASSLYLSTDYGVARLDTQQRRCLCDCHLCLATGDFYCGWDSRRGECTAAPNKNPRASYWEQEEPRCPDLFAPVSPVSFSPSPTLYVRSSILSPLLTYPN